MLLRTHFGGFVNTGPVNDQAPNTTMVDVADYAQPVQSRRRSQRPRQTGKRFECTFNGCKKFYSRAEHLQRHQLNHAPKEVFACAVEGCRQTFVRRDLYLRHTGRHDQQAQSPSSDGHDTLTSTATRRRSISTVDPASSSVSRPSMTAGLHVGAKDTEHDNLMRQPGHGNPNTLQTTHCDSMEPLDDASRQHITLDSSLPSYNSHGIFSLESQDLAAPVTLQGGINDASPSSIEEFATWLFDSNTAMHGQPNFLDLGMDNGSYPEDVQMDILDPTMISNATGLSDAVDSHRSSSSGPAVMDRSSAKSQTLSGEKWKSLIDLITGKLLESASDSDDIPQGDFEDERNPFSKHFMHSYLEAYFRYLQEYLPILHYPTFCADTAHNYLLIAILLLGSSMVRRQPESADQGIRCANLLAWNLRGHVLLHVDASPPGRLWVFQTLLLLEIHDKLLATTSLHERALVYFPTTLNLMRQSSTLFGRQVPQALKKQKSVSANSEMSVGFFAPKRSISSAPESWWEYWIVQETIRRAAFSAFALDVAHSVMFGHGPTLVFHEIHLYLPCDRILWASNSPSEVGAVESSLYANGVKPLSFLDGLRKLVNRQPCRTNSFGWLILLAGLLSIINHMQQRDLLTSSLECDLTSSRPERWQPKLINALLWWKQEYEDSLKHLRGATLEWQKLALSTDNRYGPGSDLALVIILYHLGNINIYVTISELSVAAGATKILGRPASPFEKRMIGDKIRRWTGSNGAVHAVYHAFELIRFILFPDSQIQDTHERRSRSSQSSMASNGVPHYNAAWDKLPNRSWALYFATMVIWAWGFHQDGCLDPFPSHLDYPPTETDLPSLPNEEPYMRTEGTFTRPAVNQHNSSQAQTNGYRSDTIASQNQDTQAYFDSIFPSWIESAHDFGRHLQAISGGRNCIIGLLSVTDQALVGSNWELLDEARQCLKHAAALLKTDAAV